ncbi:WD40-repeat-containing domain protein, partial [Suillus tomentosus]
GHTESVESVSFSPDGTHIVSGSWDSTVRVWDAATGLPLGEPFRGHTSWILSVSFSPDGTRVVSGSQDSTVRVWDAATEQQFQEHTDIHSSAFSSDTYPTTSCKRESIMSTDTQNNPTICFASSLEHALQNPAELLADTSHLYPTPAMPANDGRMEGAYGRLLFWVPPASRKQPFYNPRTVLVMPSGLEIDFSRMAHGEDWLNCRDV